MMSKKLNTWQQIEEMFLSGKNETIIHSLESEVNLDLCGIKSISALGSVIQNTSGIFVKDFIRVFGSDEKYQGWSYYNELKESENVFLNYFIVGNDVLGGIFAIDSENFVNYFDPKVNEWEAIGLLYSEWLSWLANGNIQDLYSEDIELYYTISQKKADYTKSYLIYPFVWSSEYSINTASINLVPDGEVYKLTIENYLKYFSQM